MTYIIAQIMGGFGTASNVIGIQLKKKAHIMIAIILANLFFCVNFFLLKAYAGALICLISGLQTFINYQYDKKGIKYPVWLITAYFVVIIACGVITYNNLIDIIPAICSIILIFVIIQSKERNIRLLTLLCISLWLIYDIAFAAYASLVSDSIMTVSTLTAIIRYDLLKQKSKG